MSIVSWLLGWIVLIVQIGAFATAARGARQRLMSRHPSGDGEGASAALASCILFVTLVVVSGQVLGTVGLFRWPALLLVSLVLAVALKPDSLLPPTLSPERLDQLSSAPAGRRGWVTRGAFLTGVAVVVTNWVAHIVAVYRLGSSDGDSMMYHLPFATKFVQSGWVSRVPHIGPDPWVAFYPANAELVQATAMLPLSHQAVVPLLSLGWLALGLLAGWCVAGPAKSTPRSGNGPLGALIAAMVLSFPILAATHAGTARVDVAAAVLVLSAVALVLREPRNLGSCIVAGLALGLAIGTKFAILPLAGLLLLAVGAVLWWREGRWLAVGWVGAAVVPSGFWLARNWVVSGSPLPMLDLRIGPVGFSRLEDPRFEGLDDTSIVDHLVNTSGFVGETLRPAFDLAFGPLPVVLALLAVGLTGVVLVVVRTRPIGVEHAVAAASVGGVIAFFLSPNSAPVDTGFGDVATTIVALNMRYLLPSLLPLLCLLPIGLRSAAHDGSTEPVASSGLHARVKSPEPASNRGPLGWAGVRAVFVGLAAAGVVMFTFLRRLGSEWEVKAGDVATAVGIVAAVAALGTLAVLAVVTTARRSQPGAGNRAGHVLIGAAALLLGVVLIGGSWYAADTHRLNRYETSWSEAAALWYATHDEPEGQKVAVVGEWLQQPFARDDLENEVEYLGLPKAHGLYAPPETCEDTQQALSEGDYDLVAVQRGVFAHEVNTQIDCVESLEGAGTVIENGAGIVARLPNS